MNRDTKELLEGISQSLKTLVGIYRGAVCQSGITGNEFWVWYVLIMIDGEYSQQDICKMLSLPKQTVNSIISNMVKKEYAVLEVIPGTRNKKVIHLTDLGKSYGSNIVMPIADAEQRAMERIPASERLACLHAITKYIVYLREEIYEHEPENKWIKIYQRTEQRIDKE